jgi:hypothetical protein
MNALRRLLDRVRHPGESDPMRQYRRWRDATGRGPYVREVREGGPWPTMAVRVRRGERRDMARRVGPIVGVRAEYTTTNKEVE